MNIGHRIRAKKVAVMETGFDNLKRKLYLGTSEWEELKAYVPVPNITTDAKDAHYDGLEIHIVYAEHHLEVY